MAAAFKKEELPASCSALKVHKKMSYESVYEPIDKHKEPDFFNKICL